MSAAHALRPEDHAEPVRPVLAPPKFRWMLDPLTPAEEESYDRDEYARQVLDRLGRG